MQWPTMKNTEQRRAPSLDAVQLRLYSQLLDAVCEEMGSVLQRSAYSPNIKERRDFSTALFDSQGRLAAQGQNIPVHLGSMFSSVEAVLAQAAARQEPLGRGDVVLLNNPYQGGTHLPDLTVVAPFYPAGAAAPVCYLANRAHHADIGGAVGGGLSLATELLQEGLVIPPVKLVRAGILQQDMLDLLLANNRTPEERRGDLAAQLAALHRGALRLNEVLGSRLSAGSDAVDEVSWLQPILDGLSQYTAAAVRQLVAELPWSRSEHSVALELPGIPESSLPVLHLRVERTGRGLRFDFSASSPQYLGSFNAVRAITLSAVFYALRCLLAEEVPTNHGLLSGIEVVTQPGTVVDALAPAAVSAANVETSQRLVDLVFGALAKLLPERMPASSQGTMNNVVFSGIDSRVPGRPRPFTYYETLAGGHGASPAGAGLSARHSHMTNTLNTPVEALELAYPLRVVRYALRPGSGGAGRWRGGDGLTREYEFLAPAAGVVLSQNRTQSPRGAAGGLPGATGSNVLRHGRAESTLAACSLFEVKVGDRFRVDTPGGGGWGRPAGRRRG